MVDYIAFPICVCYGDLLVFIILNVTWQFVVFYTSEVAFGYKGLQIQLYYTAGNLSTLFKVKYTSKVSEKFNCVQVGY